MTIAINLGVRGTLAFSQSTALWIRGGWLNWFGIGQRHTGANLPVYTWAVWQDDARGNAWRERCPCLWLNIPLLRTPCKSCIPLWAGTILFPQIIC